MNIEKPMLLTDKNRLQEIFDLRVSAYQNSPSAQYINQNNAPHGLFDRLDFSEQCYHWIIEYDHKIIASCRLCIITDLKDLSEDFLGLSLPQKGNYAFYSRLVVAESFRNRGLSYLLDQTRIVFIKAYKTKLLTLACARQDRVPALLKLGFEYLGAINVTMVDTEEPATALKLSNDNY